MPPQQTNRYKNEVTPDKRGLILQFVASAMGIEQAENESLIDELTAHARLHAVIKFQLLESPGEWQNGSIWLSTDAMTHSYYTLGHSPSAYGRQIWTKQEFIFDSHSFFEQQPRSDYIQAIEPGTFISISYPILHWLRERFPVVEEKLIQLTMIQQKYYREHMQLLNNPPLQRVKEFMATHQLFARVASNTINGIHVGLTRQGYENQLKKLN